jgi:hypothetical protein
MLDLLFDTRHHAAAQEALERPELFDWTLQGLGMFRCYLTDDKSVRLHIWDTRYATPGVTDMHTHPWGFTSRVLVGRVRDYVFRELRPEEPETKFAEICKRQTVHCGVGLVDEDPVIWPIVSSYTESIPAGDSYTRQAEQIHRSMPADGTITMVERHFDDNTEYAYVYWLANQEFVSAAPRKASTQEVREVIQNSREIWGW